MELIEKLGIDWRLLLAQILNFTILMSVLNFFLYKPILNILRKREEKIKKSIADSHKIEEELLHTEKQNQQIISKANKDAADIIKKAQEAAELKKQNILESAKKESENILIKAEQKTARLAAKAQAEIKEQMSDIVLAATEKVLAKKVNSKNDQELINEAINSIVAK